MAREFIPGDRVRGEICGERFTGTVRAVSTEGHLWPVLVKFDKETQDSPTGTFRHSELRPFLPLPESKREAAEQHAAAGIGPTAGYHDRKFDQGKPRLDLIPAECLEGIGEVLAYGAAKYAEDSWQQVPEAEKRYLAALLRHVKDIMKHGLRAVDPESGKLHIDHVATNAAFLQYFARKTA